MVLLFSAGALLVPSAAFAEGYKGPYTTLKTPKAISRINKAARRFKVNMPAFNRAFGTEAADFKRASSVEVKLPTGQSLIAPTHHFGNEIVVPYHDGASTHDAKGVQRSGEGPLSKLVGSGEVLWAVKNHRNSHPSLSLGGNVDKEEIKLQDSHAQFLVGVQRKANGKRVRGVMTFNNPQGYPGGEAGAGRFGDPTYNSLIFRPKFPSYLLGKTASGRASRNPESRSLIRAFNDNIRTMMLGFNAVTKFPGDYNGGDPLGAFTPEKAKEATRHMINAIAGTGEAKVAAERFFADSNNKVYCAELGFLSASAALHVPLNHEGVVRGLGIPEATWNNFKSLVAKHNAAQSTPFTTLNSNGQVANVKASLSPKGLKPMWAYAPEAVRQVESKKMAFRSMTSADMVGEFLRLLVGRKQLGEQAGAQIEGALLAGMKPALKGMANLGNLPETDPRVQGFNQLFSAIHDVVSRPHASYDAFRTALKPLMDQARAATGPQQGGRPGENLFAPPHLYHVMAKGFGQGEGLLGLEYAGHNVHWSQVEQALNSDRSNAR